MSEEDPRPVVITDIKIGFWRIVELLINFAIAAIPAAIIVGIIVGSVAFILGLIFASMFKQ